MLGILCCGCCFHKCSICESNQTIHLQNAYFPVLKAKMYAQELDMKYRKLVRENGMNGSKEMRWYMVGNTEVQIRFCCFLSFLFCLV